MQCAVNACWQRSIPQCLDVLSHAHLFQLAVLRRS